MTTKMTSKQINALFNEMYETIADVSDQDDPALELLINLASEACDLVTLYTSSEANDDDRREALNNATRIFENVRAHLDARRR